MIIEKISQIQQTVLWYILYAFVMNSKLFLKSMQIFFLRMYQLGAFINKNTRLAV